MDEPYVKIRGEWSYLYRAVDKEGNTVDFLLRARRNKATAKRYFEKSIQQNGVPEALTIDKSGANLAAVNAGRDTPIKIRQSKYLNNVAEQDHRTIKRIIRPTPQGSALGACLGLRASAARVSFRVASRSCI
jgi:putative transposase